MWREKYNKANKDMQEEIQLRDNIANRLNGEIEDLKEEILIAKRILKDP